MNITTIITMILCLGSVIGGFIYFLSLAMKNESKHNKERID